METATIFLIIFIVLGGAWVIWGDDLPGGGGTPWSGGGFGGFGGGDGGGC